MKNIIFFISILVTHTLYSQQYLLLDELEKEYDVKKYTLSTKKMYNIDGNIEMYNIKIQDYILLISILPNLDNNLILEKISLDTIAQENKTQLKSIMKEMISQKKIFNKYYVIKNIDNNFYISKKCLFEIFTISNKVSPHTLENNIINTNQKIVTYQDIKKKYKGYFPMENSWWGDRYSRIDNTLKSIYLSFIEEKDNEKIYHFWTFDDWHIRDGYNYHRGIDRFAYIEGKGIVGGSYDFYFDMIKSDSAIKRVVRYDIMLAKELFPERQ